MKNVTITLDEKTAARARNAAAACGKSLSRYVGELVERSMHHEGSYERAMRRFLAKPPQKLKARNSRYPGRDELHDRDRLR